MADELVPFEQLGAEGSRCVVRGVVLHEARLQLTGRRASVSGPDAVDVSRGLTFFCNRLCPFAHRAWWAMHEKGVAGEARAAAHRGVLAPQR
jgi:hypothetical protein